MLNPIWLDDSQKKLLIANLKKINTKFGNINSTAQGHSKLGSAISGIQSMCGLTVLSTPQQLEKMLSRIKLTLPKEISLFQRYITTSHLLAHSVVDLIKYKPDVIQKDKKDYYEAVGFLLLLSVLFGYNTALSCDTSDQNLELKRQYIDKCDDWFVIFESSYLPKLPSDFCLPLRSLLSSKLATLMLKVATDNPMEPHLPFSIQEMRTLINRKNERAERFGLEQRYQVIARKSSASWYQIDLDNFVLLKAELERIINNKITQPTVFLFYYTQNDANVELLRARYNLTTQKLELINVSTGNSIAQYLFLCALRMSFEEADVEVPYLLLATQANMLPAKHGNAFMAYALSGILGSCDITHLMQQRYKVSQGAFYDALQRETQEVNPLSQVHWFNVLALGEKAAWLAPTHDKITEKLVELFGKEKAKRRFEFMMRKYNLAKGDFEGNFKLPYEYAYARARSHLDKVDNPLSFFETMHRLLDDDYFYEADTELVEAFKGLNLSEEDTINEKQPLTWNKAWTKPTLKSQDEIAKLREEEGKGLRRAAARFCPFHEFMFLVSNPFLRHNISAFDAKGQYTPLHLAMRNQDSKRTLVLLEEKADVKAKHGEGESPQEIYDKLPADSPIKRNAKITPYFKQ